MIIMNEISWKYVKALNNKDSIAIFEQVIGCEIPKDIKECVTNYNGGRPSKKIFDTNLSQERVIKSLLSYNTTDLETVFDVYSVLSKENKKLVPVASDPGGNYICFDKNTKAIVLWLHETNGTEKVADSFTEFLNKLR